MKAINLFGGAFPELELSSLKSSASYLASLAFVSDKTSEWDGQVNVSFLTKRMCCYA